MKILCVIDSLGSGGAQRQMSYLVSGLKGRGHDVSLFLYHPGEKNFYPELDGQNIPIIRAKRKRPLGFDWSVVRQLRGSLAQGVEGVISFQPTAHIYVLFAKSFVRNIRWIAGERTPRLPTSSLRGVLTRCAYHLCDVIVTNSFYQAELLTQIWGLQKKVYTVWNGFPLFPEAPQTSFISNTLTCVLVVGRVSAEKNGLRLMQALSLFYRRHDWLPDIRWAGRRDTDAVAAAYQQEMDAFLADRPELATHWTWLGEVRDVQRLYAESGVLFMPSLYEGLPNAVCEAMIAGCPVIASDVCDHPRLLGQEERGLLCNPSSVASICGALERFLAMMPEERAEITASARRFAQEHLSLERMARDYETLLCTDSKEEVSCAE